MKKHNVSPAASQAPGKTTPFKLIFHVGAGKTGTSSIQESLRLSQATLAKHGFGYWGLMLESAPFKQFSWQLASASKEFLALSQQEAREQVETVLSKSIEMAMQAGCHTAIWSNEWFFGRHQAVLPALQSLERNGVEVKIVAYVRRHDAWARSAYVQWGVKHKTYEGSLMPFSEYIRKRPVRFSSTLAPWKEAFAADFILRNFDAVGDVVSDFIELFNLPRDIVPSRTNESPSMEELFLRAMYNNTHKGEVLPVNFDRLFGTKQINFNLKAGQWLESLLPSQADLERVIEISAADRQATNQMLAELGQPELATTALKTKDLAVDNDKLISVLMQIVFMQNNKIQKLQRDVKLLAQATGNEDLLKPR